MATMNRDRNDPHGYAFHHVQWRRRMYGDALCIIAVVCCACLAGCSSSPREKETVTLQSIEYYESKLLDKSFQWEGPTSNGNRIPSLHAARALAYIGDDAVPALLRALEDERIDLYSITDALNEIGLPVDDSADEIIRRDSRSLAKWWAENREKSRAIRSEHRVMAGLPPLRVVKEGE